MLMVLVTQVLSAPVDSFAFDLAVSSGTSEGCGKDGVSCRGVHANGFVFDVAFAGEGGKAGDVMMLHGNQEHKEMFFPLMRQLADKGYRCIAIDQRGYSPGARPLEKSAYSYNEIVKDIFAIADVVGFASFHMVAHDQGARVSWHSIAVSQGGQRFTTFSSLSIPHVDAFSDALYGERADLQQQIAAQYVTTFTLNNSASLHDDYWFKREKPKGFATAADYQRALWWYSGAIDSGNMAQAPIFSVEYLKSLQASTTDEVRSWWLTMQIGVREKFGEASAYGKRGVPQTVKVGKVPMPVFYLCGLGDGSDICGSRKSTGYQIDYDEVTAANSPNGYRYLEVDCGHNVLKCQKPEVAQQVCDAIVDFITTSSSHSVIV